ncbi:MAG: bifunctional diaminohydroxyphosphoribosylaminopyrimidine deaminase/5-amino-6-(5-phosphoribosylamino)uracil reductase RibD [Candidatus Rokubacteria bacterium]|nr:bifunctional diaminohydroxyphosphoribosylaminopyrimidine deaminase/5-amino-6-(5-phosphoribosylamino)uracil reductase RibD [Candidatus Rokubacteria bacterium]
MPLSALDESLMHRALALAECARGLTSPNPLVGALVVRDGVIVGEGFHLRAGAPHAESLALAVAGEAARGATLYVTLEPCVHEGRTPPCVPAIVEAGIRRVVAAVGDPNPRVAGAGLAALGQAGLEVSVGCLEEEARRLNQPFFTWITAGRPFVTLKVAMSLDGKIAGWDRSSRWITGEEARRETHRLRSQADAIAVGISTVLADDPELTVRLEPAWPREPYRVVVDSHGRTPTTSRVLAAGSPERTLIAVTESAPEDRLRALEASGARVLRLPARDGRVDLGALMADLAQREVTALLLEGGGELNAGFLEAGLVDRVAVFVAPMLLGGRDAPTPLGGPGRGLKEAFRLARMTVKPVGEDLLVEGDIARENEDVHGHR